MTGAGVAAGAGVAVERASTGDEAAGLPLPLPGELFGTFIEGEANDADCENNRRRILISTNNAIANEEILKKNLIIVIVINVKLQKYMIKRRVQHTCGFFARYCIQREKDT